MIFVSPTIPEAAVAQDIEAYGLEMQWAPRIRAAVDLLNSTREKTVIVTQLARRTAIGETSSNGLGVLDAPSNGTCDFCHHGGTLVGRA